MKNKYKYGDLIKNNCNNCLYIILKHVEKSNEMHQEKYIYIVLNHYNKNFVGKIYGPDYFDEKLYQIINKI